MFLRSLFQVWLQNTAKAKLRDAVMQAAAGQVAQAARPPATASVQCHVGVVFALGIESGCLEDRLQGAVAIQGDGFSVREGGLNGRRAAIILSGPGRDRATRATNMLIDGHRPQRIVSAGFAGALCPELRRNDILVADRLRTTGGEDMPVDLPAGLAAALQHRDVHRGTLLTADCVIRVPSEKRAIGQRFGAMAVDMETFAVADVCRRRGVPFSSIRVINDTSDEVLPTDVEYLLGQKPGAAQWGAALGAVLRRPASAKDMYQLRENALVASLRLAKFMAEAGFE